MALAQEAGPSITGTIDAYMRSFNENDLDGVMTHFAEDAVYRPGNGVERVGRAAIREEFELQFSSGLGAMRFDEVDRVVDERTRKIVIRYLCRHDLAWARPRTLSLRLQRILAGALVGDRFGWEGVDVFHFDEAAKIARKFTYAGYTRPRLEKSLGVRLPAPAAAAARRGA
jgi:ketosteroid isomerase-like protein